MSAAEVAAAVAELLLGADDDEVQLVSTVEFMFVAFLVTVLTFVAIGIGGGRPRRR